MKKLLCVNIFLRAIKHITKLDLVFKLEIVVSKYKKDKKEQRDLVFSLQKTHNVIIYPPFN